MEWIPVDLQNPLILLRVYLALLWAITAFYGIKVVWGLPFRSGLWPIGAYSVAAALTGAASYFLGAATVFTSLSWFLWVAVLLTFTPVSLILWLHYALALGRDEEDS